MDILYLITEAADAPAVSSLVNGIHNVGIQGLPLLEEERCKLQSLSLPINGLNQESPKGAHWWLTPIILATQQARD
jgi:hypothetical protein